MTHRALKTHVQRRYRAGARLALLATLLVGTALSGVFGTAPSVEISQQAAPAPDRATDEARPPVPDPEIEPASLPAPSAPQASAYREALVIDGPVEFERPATTPSVERLVL